MSILFLDVDGVLNDHTFNEVAESNTLKPECVQEFNRILLVCRPKVVLTSAWRYMVLGGAMSLQGFAYMLRTHGVAKEISSLLLGTTALDRDERGIHRGRWIQEWLKENHSRKPGSANVGERFAVLDDAPEGMCFDPMTQWLVKTNGKVGLTSKEANQIISLLGAWND